MATSVGRAMAQIPVDLSFARWLVAAQQEDCLSDMIALVSTLSTRRHYLRPGADLDAHPILETGCDAAAIMSAQGGGRAPSFVTRDAFAEANEIARQLEELLDCPKRTDGDMPSRRRSLAKAVMACDPGAVTYVARLRKSKESAWYNGKIEALLDTRSLLALSRVAQGARKPEALLALSTHAYSPRLGRGGSRLPQPCLCL